MDARRGGRARWFAAGCVALALLVVPAPAHASVADTSSLTPRVNGPVYAIAQVGDLTVLGGSFTTVGGKPRLNIAAVRADGTVDPDFHPDTDGIVRALAGSADGTTVYVGGRFSTVGGVDRGNLAAVDADSGQVLGSWSADTTGASPGVFALTSYDNRLYVGGTYSGIDGRARASMVAVDPAGDVVTDFRPRANAGVRAIRVSPDGATVYAGGAFSKLGGAERPWGVGGVLATTGDATAFDPSLGGDLSITIGLSPDGSRLYFSTPSNYLYAYDVGSNTPAWVIKTSGDTQAILPTADEVYIGGHFSQVVTYKIKRNFLASVRVADGTVTPWDPNPLGGDMGVWAITATPTELLVGGTFTTVNGLTCVRFARFAGTA